MARVPSYDIVIVVDAFSEKVVDLPRQLRPLWARLDGSNLVGVDVLYRHPSDSALLLLRLDPRAVTGPILSAVHQAADQAGLRVVELPRLPQPDRDLTFKTLSRQYEPMVVGAPSPEEALEALGTRLGVMGPEPASARVLERASMGVRVQRNGAWDQGRVVRLSDAGLQVATSSVPRRGEILRLELVQGDLRLGLFAQVVHVTTPRAAVDIGASGFGARFLFPERELHSQLKRFMTLSRALLAAPPKRREPRYLLRWPVSLSTPRGPVDATALDVSLRGLFVQSLTAFPMDHRVELKVADTAGEVHAWGRVARVVTPADAQRRGLSPGMGLEFDGGDGRAFQAFVEQVARRAEHRVLVGATAARMETLVDSLGAAGYSAVGAPSAGALLKSAAEPLAPHLVVIDQSLGREPEMRRLLRQVHARAILVLNIDRSAGSVHELVDAHLNAS